MARVLFVISEDWALRTHRLHLVKSAASQGHHVAVAAKMTDFKFKADLEELGIIVFDWKLERGSASIFRELSFIKSLREIIKKFTPDLIHCVALKPVIYAAFASFRFGRPPLVATLGGVGSLYLATSFKARALSLVVSSLLYISLIGEKRFLILQNWDDVALIMKKCWIKSDKIQVIRGAGVEIEKFALQKEDGLAKLIVLPARFLKDKGIFEFAEVAKKVRVKRKDVRFVLVGDFDFQNPTAVPKEQLDEWEKNGIVEVWRGVKHEDMPMVFCASTVVCLPSYREGMPKALLEASSSGRPVVAFDVPGCRDIVKHGHNGFLVPFGDLKALEAHLLLLINDKQMRVKFGLAGRDIVEKNFSSEIINTQTFTIWNNALFGHGK